MWSQNRTSAWNLSLLALGTDLQVSWPTTSPFRHSWQYTSLRLHLQSTGVCYLLWRSFGVHIAAAYFFSLTSAFSLSESSAEHEHFFLDQESLRYPFGLSRPTLKTRKTYEHDHVRKITITQIHFPNDSRSPSAATPLLINLSKRTERTRGLKCLGFQAESSILRFSVLVSLYLCLNSHYLDLFALLNFIG